MSKPVRQKSPVYRDNKQKNDNCVTASKQHHLEITLSDLPLSCPMPGECLWDAHPRVYLWLDENGYAHCPYCGREFVLGKTANGG